ncbi:hypothetical protein [Delftia acidovorans]|uniref:hypothetical protein n=1 Tax=Delftia acidovorans TaxID=80866 RepID=UPI0005C1DC51|nr:hypothetical protein [Delftia acidovorans]
MSNYIVHFNLQFAQELTRVREDQQLAVGEFVSTFQSCGLQDPTKYPGRISPSWLNAGAQNFDFAKRHDLWHYHLGLPEYRRGRSVGGTSDWLLHFQWRNSGDEITLLDMYQHYTTRGDFYLPPASRIGALENE